MNPNPHVKTEYKLRQGIHWNLVSFGVLGLAGVAMNMLVAHFYPPSALGVFNQVLAIFILGGQFGSMAIHYSVLYHVPKALARAENIHEPLFSALLLTLITSSALAFIVWMTSGLIAKWLNSAAVAAGLNDIILGLVVFPLNKVLLAYLNAVRQVRLYAIGNAARYVLIVAFILAFVHAGFPGERLALSLTLSESVLFAGLIIATRNQLHAMPQPVLLEWCRRHLRFGIKGVAGATLSEMNTRIDVLVLGVLSDDTAVGIYSIASIFAEGLFQLIMVLRFNYDPVMTRMIGEKNWADLRILIRDGKRLAYLAMIGVGALAVALYPKFMNLVLRKPDYSGSWLIFIILVSGITISAGYIPFGGLLQQAGHPGMQSVLIILVLITNLCGNLLLIPHFGVAGAALGAAISQVMFVIYLTQLVRRTLDFKL